MLKRRDTLLVKRSAFFALLFVALLVFSAASAWPQPVGTIKDVIEPTGSSGKVNWTNGVVTAVGIGAPSAQTANAAQARGMAERTAQMAACRNLLEAIKGVRVDSNATVEKFMVTSDVIKTKVSDIIQGATVMDKKYMSDGSVEVTVAMKLSGALADALLPEGPATPPAPPASDSASADHNKFYTGLVVDARGLGIRPAMAPKNTERKREGSLRLSPDQQGLCCA